MQGQGRAFGATTLVVLLATLSFIALMALPRGAMAYVPHAPITIVGDGNFTSVNGVSGGNGTPGNPYVIEGWDINASAARGIALFNTNASFVVRNVYVHSGGSFFDGVYLSRVLNGTVRGSLITGNSHGLSIYSCTNVTVTGNNASKNSYGVYASSSMGLNVSNNNMAASTQWGFYAYGSRNLIATGNTVSWSSLGGMLLFASDDATLDSNTFSSNTQVDIYLLYSSRGNVVGNTFTRGVLLYGNALAQYDTHTIPTNNLVNGRPLYYYKDCNGLTLDGTFAGEVIVAICANVRVTRLSIAAASVGVELAYVNIATVTANNFSRGQIGILLVATTNANVTVNDLWNNQGGIELYSSTAIRVYHNNLLGNVVQAHDDRGPENAWDDGYPSGGNFWSNYTGGDSCSGPAQNVCTGPDGIGDIPANVDANTTDRYPLRERYIPPNTAPTASFTLSQASGSLATIFTVDASSSSDAQDPPSSLQVRWDWDGSQAWTPWSFLKTASRQYPAPATYTIHLEVMDTGGMVGTSTRQVVVAPALQVSISGNPAAGTAPLTVTFSSAITGGLPTYTYNWSFGDGGTSSDANPSHAYASAGNYTVSLTVTDGVGQASTRTMGVTVNAGNPFLAGGLTWILLAALVGAAVVGLVAAKVAFARRKRTPEPEIEEIFVVHKDGTLLAHRSKTLTPDKDEDVLTGMFTAVQEFISDSFGYGKDRQVKGLSIGDYSVEIQRGEHVYVAVVFKGTSTPRIRSKLQAVVKELEADYGQVLAGWAGNVDAVRGMRDRVRELLED